MICTFYLRLLKIIKISAPQPLNSDKKPVSAPGPTLPCPQTRHSALPWVLAEAQRHLPPRGGQRLPFGFDLQSALGLCLVPRAPPNLRGCQLSGKNWLLAVKVGRAHFQHRMEGCVCSLSPPPETGPDFTASCKAASLQSCLCSCLSSFSAFF